MSYRLCRRISHAEVDFLGEVKMFALLGILEQAAVEASRAAGYDADRYTREGRVWIIRRTRLERRKPVGGIDEVEVETAVTDVRRARSFRSYTVRREGETVAEALTDWIYCDLVTGRPARIPAELQRAIGGEGALPALPRDEVPPSPSTPAFEWATVVHPSHLDHVVHVNNGIYASYLEDAAFEAFREAGWPLGRMLEAGGALRITHLDCEYFADAQHGDRLTVRSWLSQPESFASTVPPDSVHLRHSIGRADGRELLRAETGWTWRRRPAVLGGVPSES